MSFRAYDPTLPISFPSDEVLIQSFWDKIQAFPTQQRLHEGQPLFSFYDGPPFATGLPHYGHLLLGIIKDVVTRHAWALGYDVPRRFGWDCHGVPIEHIIDKKLSISSRADVMNLGLKTYNAACRDIVMTHSEAWRSTVNRIGRWIDFDRDYKTLDPTFMESVWWVFSELFKKGLVYRSYRVMPYSTALHTPLSTTELANDHRMVQDPAVTVAFPLVDRPGTSLLAWTTTPWTLPSNLALCVNPDLVYIEIHDTEKNCNYILLEKLLSTLYKDPKKAKFKKVASFKGSEMKGWEYVPLFDFFKSQFPRAFRVLNDPYVLDSSGTGIVHQAPAFGDDDYRIASLPGSYLDRGVMPPCPVDDNGNMFGLTGVGEAWNGMYFKDADKHIAKQIKEQGRLVVQAVIMHSYPFCWRSGTPILYRAVPSWFVKVQPVQEKMANLNSETLWVPQHVGEMRFGNWLKNARDWNVSRSRYWGTPLPLWVSEDFEEVICIGSVAQLEELSGVKGITDLHRDSIDDITIPSAQGKGVLKRVNEVFDCWFESGSMPYAQCHYPFENKEKFEKSFPANFISEGMDQTRGWFYSLMVIATHLFGVAPWKNLIVTGLVLAEDGKKMSKKLNNYPDPEIILEKYGADALRLYLVDSPIVKGEDLRFREDGVKEVVTKVLLPWHNAFRFFVQHVLLLKDVHQAEFNFNPEFRSNNVMDKWILARCQTMISVVKTEMAAYRLSTVLSEFVALIDDLTNWYIRFNRKRCKGENGVDDAISALSTLFETLLTLCCTMSCFVPFLTENIYQTLREYLPKSEKDNRSVHFLDFPSVNQAYYDPVIERQVKRMQAVIDLGRIIRDGSKRGPASRVSLKTPLRDMKIFHPEQQYLDDVSLLQDYVKEGLNVQDIIFSSDASSCHVGYEATADWPVLGKKLRGNVGRVKAALPSLTSAQVLAYQSSGEITVDDIALVMGDLVVSQTVSLPEGSSWDAHTDREVVVLLDLELYPELIEERNTRELINRIQRLRKNCSLVATDNVDAFYRSEAEDADFLPLRTALENRAEQIMRVTRSNVRDEKEMPTHSKVIACEEQDINEVKFFLTLIRVSDFGSARIQIARDRSALRAKTFVPVESISLNLSSYSIQPENFYGRLLRMLDHLLGRPASPTLKRVQVILVLMFWVWRIVKGSSRGPRMFQLRSINRQLTKFSPWQIVLSSMTFLYALKNFDILLGLGAPEPLARLYSPNYYRATWIATAFDAGFATGMTIQPKWLRDISQVVFALYYLGFSTQASAKLRKYRACCSVELLRTTWEKTSNPYIRFFTKFDRPSLGMCRNILISRPESSKYRTAISAMLLFDGTPEELASRNELIIDMPGGAFVCMGPIHHEERLRHWAKTTGRPVLSIDYGKAPERPYPYAINEFFDLYCKLQGDNGKFLGLSGEKQLSIILSGDSAGGNIITAGLYKVIETKPDLPRPIALVLTYPCLDFNFTSWMTPDNLQILKTEQSVYNGDDNDYRELPSKQANVSELPDIAEKQKAREKTWSRQYKNQTPTSSVHPRSLGPQTDDKSTLPSGTTPNGVGDAKTTKHKPRKTVVGTRLTMTSRSAFFNDVIISPAMMRASAILYMGPHASPDFSSDYMISPVLAPDHLLCQLPPVLIVCGESDPFVDDSLILAGRIREAKSARQASEIRIRELTNRGSFAVNNLRKDRGPDLLNETEADWVDMRIVQGWSHGFLQMLNVLAEAKVGCIKMGEWMSEAFDKANADLTPVQTACPSASGYRSDETEHTEPLEDTDALPEQSETKSKFNASHLLQRRSSVDMKRSESLKLPLQTFGSDTSKTLGPFLTGKEPGSKTRANSSSVLISNGAEIRQALLDEGEIMRRRRQGAVQGFGEVILASEPGTPGESTPGTPTASGTTMKLQLSSIVP